MQCAVYVPASAVEKTNSNNYIDLATCTKQIKVNIKVCEIVDKQSWPLSNRQPLAYDAHFL